MAMTFLKAAHSSTPTTSSLAYVRKVSEANSSWKNAAVPASGLATTVPDGMPRITSAAKLGPERTARRAALPISASNTSTGRRPLPSSTPFEQTIAGKSSPTSPASRSATSRMMLEGVTITAALAPSSTSSYAEAAAMRPDSVTSPR